MSEGQARSAGQWLENHWIDASVCCGSAITAIAEALDEIPLSKNAHGDGPVSYALVLTIVISQPDNLILA